MTRKMALTILSVSTFFWALGAVVGVLPALMTPMMFDSPTAISNPVTITLALSIATFPIVCVLAMLMSWLVFLLPALAHMPYHYTLACGLAALPLLNIATATAAIAWLTYFNQGSFS